MSIFERVKELNLPLGEYAVFGSALLDVWGIRKAADLDIIVTPQLYEKLKKEGWEEHPYEGFNYLVKGDADVTTVQDKPTTGDYLPDRVQLIQEAVIIQGVPFVQVEEVIACKHSYGRPKDIIDIASLEKYIKKHAGRDLYAA